MIRLRADPARLRAAMLGPEGSLARAGMSLYLQTEEGKDRLARAYFDACDSWFPGREKGMVIFAVGGVLCVGEVEGPGSTGSGELGDNERDRFIRSAMPFLAPLRGRSFRSEGNPGFKVSFLAADEAWSRTAWYVSKDVYRRPHVRKGPFLMEEELAAMKAATALLDRTGDRRVALGLLRLLERRGGTRLTSMNSRLGDRKASHLPEEPSQGRSPREREFEPTSVARRFYSSRLPPAVRQWLSESWRASARLPPENGSVTGAFGAN